MLQVESFNVRYGSVIAATGIAFEVERGSIVSLIGANGAGKTSILSGISGLVASSGSVKLDGEQVSGKPTEYLVRKGLVQVPQGRQLFPQMSVRENLEIGAYLLPAEQRRERYENLLQRFPLLRERTDQFAGTLSGGEQQIVAIARGLMAGPRILLLDEPCLGLSPIMVKRIGALVRELRADGLTILLAEQNAAFAFGLADRIIGIENGRIALSGSAEEVRQNPSVRQSYLGI